MRTLPNSPKLRGLARNPALPPHLLNVFVATADARLSAVLAYRDDLSAKQLHFVEDTAADLTWVPFADFVEDDPAEASPEHPDEEVRRHLAVRTDLPQEVYARLAKDPVAGIRRDLAGNPAVHESLLRELATEPDRELHRSLLHNPAIPLDLLVSVAESTDIGPTLVPRVDAATDAELRTLAGSPVARVRMLVAERTDLPAELIDLFVADPDVGVAKGIVTNPALTAEQLWALVTRHRQRLYPRAARNPNCPPDLLHHLALNARWAQQTYQDVARHPHAQAETLLLCLRDRDARRDAAKHPNLPTETILELLDDRELAEAAAANPSLPESVMAELLGV